MHSRVTVKVESLVYPWLKVSLIVAVLFTMVPDEFFALEMQFGVLALR